MERYFWCERYGKRFPKTLCLAMQNVAKGKKQNLLHPERCIECPQGQEIAVEVKNGGQNEG